MTTLQTQGTTFSVGNGDSPLTYTAIGNVVNIGGPSGSAPVVDTTNLASTSREKNMGIPDEGQITLTCQYLPSDTGQTRCATLKTGQTREHFKITLTDSPATLLTFYGYVLNMNKTWDIDSVAMMDITIEIDGAVSET